MKRIFPGVFLEGRLLLTKNLVKGFKVHGERLLEEHGAEYRVWNPFYSKLGAAIAKGLSALPIKPGSAVLYLGAAQGVTASFVSDIVGAKGRVYCVEFSPRAMQDLLRVCEKRENMLPLLGDARKPEEYADEISEKIDVLYEDVADPQQTDILERNADLFLKPKGFALIAVKAACISSTEKPEKIFAETEKRLAKKFEVVEKLSLEPFEKGHAFFVLRKK